MYLQAAVAAWLTWLVFIAQFLLLVAAHSCILMSMAHPHLSAARLCRTPDTCAQTSFNQCRPLDAAVVVVVVRFCVCVSVLKLFVYLLTFYARFAVIIMLRLGTCWPRSAPLPFVCHLIKTLGKINTNRRRSNWKQSSSRSSDRTSSWSASLWLRTTLAGVC